MRRAARILITVLSLAACAQDPAHQGPYAPGLAKSGPTVDPLIVAHRLMDAGEYELAQTAYSRAAVTQGMTPDILAGLGSANLALGRLGTAERLLRRAIESEEATPETWNNLGVVLAQDGQPEEALDLFDRAIGARPEAFRPCSSLPSQTMAKASLPRPLPVGSTSTRTAAAAIAASTALPPFAIIDRPACEASGCEVETMLRAKTGERRDA